MKIPRYWKQAYKNVSGINFHNDHFKSEDQNSADIFAWGYSDISVEDAAIQADVRVNKIIKALESKIDENFYYPLSELREDILDELCIEDEELGKEGSALVTRNRYFSRVLNTDKMMFVDIDVPTQDIKPASFWQKLLGKASQVEERNKLEIEKRFNDTLSKVENYAAGDPKMGFLIYRTFAGFRLIASHTTFDPNSKDTQQIFDGLGADPLYQKLCKVQECFRARLTPKFWRLNKNLGICPSIKFRITSSMISDWTDDHERRVNEYDDWIEIYEEQHITHATCQFIKHIGNQTIIKRLKPLIDYHDEITQARSGKSLA